MSKIKPTLNQADIALLKKIFPTKVEVRKIVSDEVHNQLTNYHADMVQPEFDKIDKRFEKVDERFEKVDERFDNLENNVKNNHGWLKDEINGLKSDLSTTVSKKEFGKLKAKVDKHPTFN